MSGLADLIAADTNERVTLMITASSPGTLYYAGSKESAFTSRTSGVAIPLGTIAPRLILTVPEPATPLLAFWALAFGLMARRRRAADRIQ